MPQRFLWQFDSVSWREVFLRYRFSPALLIVLIPPLVLVLILVLVLPASPKDYLVLISAIALLIGVLVTQAIVLYSGVRDRAFALLTANRDDKEWREASRDFGGFIIQCKGQLSADFCRTWWQPADEEHKKIGRAIRFIANFFEEMAIGIKFGEMDEALLQEFYIGMFVRFYDYCKPLWPIMRNDPPSEDCPYSDKAMPEVYCNLDYLYGRWKPKYEKLKGQ